MCYMVTITITSRIGRSYQDQQKVEQQQSGVRVRIKTGDKGA